MTAVRSFTVVLKPHRPVPANQEPMEPTMTTAAIIPFPSLSAAPEPVHVPSAWIDALSTDAVRALAGAMRRGVLDCPELRAAAIDLPVLVQHHGVERAAQRTGLPTAFVQAWTDGWTTAA